VVLVQVRSICWPNRDLTYMRSVSQKINPVDASTKVLRLNKDDQLAVSSTQTGYKRTPVGIVLHFVAISILLGWCAVLAVTTALQYEYASDTDNYLVALKWFCLTWNFAFLWSMAMYWPQSIRSLFLRRCLLSEATHVAVFYQFGSSKHAVGEMRMIKLPRLMLDVFAWLASCHEKIMILLFATPDARPDPTKGILKYCLVETNPDGTRYFTFLFRRYNFDNAKQIFVPGSFKLGGTFAELAPKGATIIDELEKAYLHAVGDDPTECAPTIAPGICPAGLSNQDVVRRRQAIGANVIEMEKPMFLKEFVAEMSKPFYLYQFYILWIWMPVQYYYMACVNWGIILLAATVISWFRYRNVRTLFGISQVDGQVTVLRDRTRIKVDHSELVPGDVVELGQGSIHSDMLLLTGDVMVDESNLTGEATPQAKVPIDPFNKHKYDPVEHKRHTLFGGTQILGCDNALALVVRTGSYTTKGELMREIVAFRTHRLQFYIELPIVLGILSTYSAAMFIFVYLANRDEPVVGWVLGM
jgi:E1-E2 ATPase